MSDDEKPEVMTDVEATCTQCGHVGKLHFSLHDQYLAYVAAQKNEARFEEREAIVEWLLRPGYGDREAIYADALERGDHLKPTGDGESATEPEPDRSKVAVITDGLRWLDVPGRPPMVCRDCGCDYVGVPKCPKCGSVHWKKAT